MSFKPDLVREVLPQLAMEPAERPAQVWIDVADLTGKQLAGAVNALGYMRVARNVGRRVPVDEHAGQPAARAARRSAATSPRG